MSEKCPKCGSKDTYVTSDSRGKFSAAVLGDVAVALIAGMLGQKSPIGNFLGTRAGTMSGNTKRECHCRNCRAKWYK